MNNWFKFYISYKINKCSQRKRSAVHMHKGKVISIKEKLNIFNNWPLQIKFNYECQFISFNPPLTCWLLIPQKCLRFIFDKNYIKILIRENNSYLKSILFSIVKYYINIKNYLLQKQSSLCCLYCIEVAIIFIKLFTNYLKKSALIN